MTVGGKGIPRLQELTYLEAVAKAAAEGLPFEGIRLALVEHIWAYAEASASSDPPDPALYRTWRSDEKKFVRNVTDSLKELMRLGFMDGGTLPSSVRSAYTHKDATYRLTSTGTQWVETVASDRRRAYDELLPQLVAAHPGFSCFLSTVGVIGNAESETFVVPLLRWGQLPGDRSHP